MRRTLWMAGVLTIAAVVAVLVGSHLLEERSFVSGVRESAQILLGTRDGNASEAARTRPLSGGDLRSRAERARG
jgi:hypothetical protein